MGTRGVIARQHGDGFIGRYHHWDSYPTGLGKTLWDVHHEHFNGDLSRMLEVLLDEHPAGWSSINNADWTQEPGFDSGEAPACYCHGSRDEDGQDVDYISDCGAEWGYVFNEEARMLGVLKARRAEQTEENPRGWHLVWVGSLDGAEPNWEALEEAEYR